MALTDIPLARANVLAELEKVIDHAKLSLKSRAWVTVEHHWRDQDEREGVGFGLPIHLPADKVCIGATIKITWDTMR